MAILDLTPALSKGEGVAKIESNLLLYFKNFMIRFNRFIPYHITKIISF
jgi:hypothetical protein